LGKKTGIFRRRKNPEFGVFISTWKKLVIRLSVKSQASHWLIIIFGQLKSLKKIFKRAKKLTKIDGEETRTQTYPKKPTSVLQTVISILCVWRRVQGAGFRVQGLRNKRLTLRDIL
jgi:hypothetical protein